MRGPWLHVDVIGAPGATVSLDPAEVRHAVGARRLRDGDEVVLCDGRGTLARAVLGHQGTSASVLVREEVAAPVPRVTLAAALPKGDRSAVMIDMATQVGMSRFIPLRCEHSVVEATPNLLQRLRRVAMEACKQSRRAHLPVVEGPRDLAELLESLRSAVIGETHVWLAEPTGGPVPIVERNASDVLILIGPEGGFTTDEIDLAKTRGAVPVRLGEGILRIEAAAVVAVHACRVMTTSAGA